MADLLIHGPARDVVGMPPAMCSRLPRRLGARPREMLEGIGRRQEDGDHGARPDVLCPSSLARGISGDRDTVLSLRSLTRSRQSAGLSPRLYTDAVSRESWL